MTRGERIKQVRDFYGLSQEDFGGRLGLGRSFISLLENNKRHASERTLKDICEKYGVNYHWLAQGTGTMRSADHDIIETFVQSLVSISIEDKEIIETYLCLPKNKRKAFREFLKEFGK